MQKCDDIIKRVQDGRYSIYYSLSYHPTVAVALLHINLVTLIPDQLLQGVWQRQLPLLLLLLTDFSPLCTAPLETTHRDIDTDTIF